MEKLNNIIAQLDDMLADDKRDKYPYHHYATATFITERFTIEVFMDSTRAEVLVTNKDKFGIEYPNIEKYIADRLCDYDSIEVEDDDEWNVNGFKDESDYIRYRFG